MQLEVDLRVGDGRQVTLTAGSIIGRMPGCALHVDDPRMSEAHALVSFRGGELRLLALRGRISVRGTPRTEVPLLPGRRILLAGYLTLEVLAVRLPSMVIAVAVDGDLTDVVSASGVLAFTPDGARPKEGFQPDAQALLWVGDRGPTLRLVAQPGDALEEADPERPGFAPAVHGVDRVLAVGDAFEVGGRVHRLVEIARAGLETNPTADQGHHAHVLRIVLFFDTVHVMAQNGRTVVIDGLAARAISYLLEIRQPISWEQIAARLWPDEPPNASVRQRWDQMLTRVRQKLRAAAIRSDLVRANRHGLVEVLIGERDKVEDRT